jgi:hypothetical protein
VIANRVDQVGYLRAEVPTSKVVRAAALPGVAAVDLDESVRPPDPRPDAKPDKPGKGTPPARARARPPTTRSCRPARPAP